MLWALFTLIAATAQTARNAMQRDLVSRLGTIGATQVRFLFGWPFAVLLLGFALAVTGEALPGLNISAALWIVLGACSQIAGTALMLKAMAARSFAVTTAYIKTEPVQVALFGLVFLGDRLSPGLLLAILIATAGVMTLAWPKDKSAEAATQWQPAVLGLLAGSSLALSAIGFRGAIHALDGGGVWVRATTVLAIGLILQTLILLVYMLIREPRTLQATVAAWRPSLLAGFTGAFASQFWFLGFALATAAQVRTLALVEVLMAYAISGRLFNERMSRRDMVGLVLVVIGVSLALNA